MRTLTETENDDLIYQALYDAVKIKFAELQLLDEKHYYLVNSYLQAQDKYQMTNMIAVTERLQTSVNKLMLSGRFNQDELHTMLIYLTLWLGNMHYHCKSGLSNVAIIKLFIQALSDLQYNPEALKKFMNNHFYHQLTKLCFLESSKTYLIELTPTLLLYTDMDKLPTPTNSASEWSVYWCKINISCLAFRYMLYLNENQNEIQNIGKKISNYLNKIISIHGSNKHTYEPASLLWYGMIRLDGSQFLSMYNNNFADDCLDFTEKNKESINKYTIFLYEIHKKHINVTIEIIKNSSIKNILFKQVIAHTSMAIHANIQYFIKARKFLINDKNHNEFLKNIINNLFVSLFSLLDITKKEFPTTEKQFFETHYQLKEQFDNELSMEKEQIRAEKNRLQFEKSLDEAAIKKSTIASKKSGTIKNSSQKKLTENINYVPKNTEEESPRYVINPILLPSGKDSKSGLNKQKTITKNTLPTPPAIPQNINNIPRKKMVTTYPREKPNTSKLTQPEPAIIKIIPTPNMKPTYPWKKLVIDNPPATEQRESLDKTSEIQGWHNIVNISRNQLETHLTILNMLICSQMQNNGFLCDNDLQQFETHLHQLLNRNDYEMLCNAYEFFSVEEINLHLYSDLKGSFINIKIAMSTVHQAMQCLQTNLLILQESMQEKQIQYANLYQKISINLTKLSSCLTHFQTIRHNINISLKKKNIYRACTSYPLPVRQVFDLLGKNARVVGSTVRKLFENAPDVIGKDLDYILCIDNEKDIQKILNLGFIKNNNLTHIDMYSAILDLQGCGPKLVEVVCVKYSKNWLKNDVHKRDFTTAIYGDFYGNILDISKKGFHAINKNIIEIPGNAAKRIAQDPVLLLRIIDRLLDKKVLTKSVELAMENWSPNADYFLHKSHINATAKKYMDSWGAEAFTKMLHQYDLLTRLFGITHKDNWEETITVLTADIATTAPSYLRAASLFGQSANNVPVDEIIPLNTFSQSS